MVAKRPHVLNFVDGYVRKRAIVLDSRRKDTALYRSQQEQYAAVKTEMAVVSKIIIKSLGKVNLQEIEKHLQDGYTFADLFVWVIRNQEKKDHTDVTDFQERVRKAALGGNSGSRHVEEGRSRLASSPSHINLEPMFFSF